MGPLRGTDAPRCPTPNVEELERQFNAAMEEADTGSTLEAMRQVYGELDCDDTEVAAAILHPKFELHIDATFLSGKTYKGAKGFTAWREEMDELFDENRFQPVGVRSAGRDRWVVLGRLHVTEARRRRRAGPAARPTWSSSATGRSLESRSTRRSRRRWSRSASTSRNLAGALRLDQRRALLQLLDVAFGGLDALERGLRVLDARRARTRLGLGPHRLSGLPCRAALVASRVVRSDELRTRPLSRGR